MKITYAEEDTEYRNPIYQISWKEVVAFLEMPVVGTLRIHAPGRDHNGI
jgi:glutamine cyclotransferase